MQTVYSILVVLGVENVVVQYLGSGRHSKTLVIQYLGIDAKT